ncbi:flagellar filament capping protein FliD [Leifsonia sp. L25]|uniref:flagellar filament capping protein FliD n=2 Tax=Leifsonia TaxID=110932 RepID=UPI003D6857B0
MSPPRSTRRGVGVSATQVAAGLDPATGQQLYRLQLSSTKTGTAGAFTAYRGTTADVTAGTATNLLSDPGAAQVRAAQDAQLTLWAGTGAAQTVTSSTNTFSDVLPGVAVTVTAASATPVTLTVARDDKSLTAAASSLVSSVNDIFTLIASKQAVATTTDAAGGTVVTGGPFTGDSTTRDVNQKLVDAISAPVNGVSPSTYGISIQRDGTVAFDDKVFGAAMAADPVTVKAALTTIAQRVADASTAASDTYTGSLSADQGRAVDRQRPQRPDHRLGHAAHRPAVHPREDVREPRGAAAAAPVPVLLADRPALLPPDCERLMNVLTSAAAKLSAYNRDSVLSASPARLLTMLYDRLLLDLTRGEAALQATEWPTAWENLRHADQIVAELAGSLRVDLWDGADGLLQLYGYLADLIVGGMIERDAGKVREAIELAEPLRQTWHEAARLLPAATTGEADRDLGVA